MEDARSTSSLPDFVRLNEAGDNCSQQDVFISHAGEDKLKYVFPIVKSLGDRAISYWLDSEEISWGDSIAMKINMGLMRSRFVLLCLSPRFCDRPWPENELTAALSMQNSQGRKRVLPLILYSKKVVLERYPILAGFAYREYNGEPEKVAADVDAILRERSERDFFITIATIHTGVKFDLVVPPRVSNGWVIEQIARQLQVRIDADFGYFMRLHVRFVIVDSSARSYWEELPLATQSDISVVVNTKDGVKVSHSFDAAFDLLGVSSGTVFNVYPIQAGPLRCMA